MNEKNAHNDSQHDRKLYQLFRPLRTRTTRGWSRRGSRLAVQAGLAIPEYPGAYISIYSISHLLGTVTIRDAIKQNEAEVEKNQILFFWHLLFAYYLSFKGVSTQLLFLNVNFSFCSPFYP